MSEEDCLKYVEEREKRMTECFKEAVQRHDRQYNFEKVVEDDLVYVYDMLDVEC